MVDFRGFDWKSFKQNLKLDDLNFADPDNKAFQLFKSAVLNSESLSHVLGGGGGIQAAGQILTFTAQYLMHNNMQLKGQQFEKNPGVAMAKAQEQFGGGASLSKTLMQGESLLASLQPIVDASKYSLPVSSVLSGLVTATALNNNCFYTSLLMYPSAFHWHARAIIATYLTMQAAIMNLEEPTNKLLENIEIVYPNQNEQNPGIMLVPTQDQQEKVESKNNDQNQDQEKSSNFRIKIILDKGTIQIT